MRDVETIGIQLDRLTRKLNVPTNAHRDRPLASELNLSLTITSYYSVLVGLPRDDDLATAKHMACVQ